MGSSQRKLETFKFDETKFNHLVQSSPEEFNQIMIKEYHCVNMNHDKKYIDIVCINLDCKAKSRKLCSLCIRDEIHIRDKNFSISKLKSVKEISQIIHSFQDLIQQESKSFEFDLLITKLDLLNHKIKQQQNQLLQSSEQLFESLEDFNKNVSNISIEIYMDHLTNANTSLFEYFQQISFQLIELQNQHKFYSLQIQSSGILNQEIKQIGELDKKKHQIILYLNLNSNYTKKMQNDKAVRDLIEREIEYTFSYVCQLYKSKNYDAVIQICQEVLMQIKLSESQEQNLLKIRTKTYFKIGKIDEATQLCHQLDSSFPKIQYFLKLKAEQFVKENNFDKAISVYDQLIQNYPHYHFSYFEKAKLLEISHNYEDALVVYDQIIQLKPYEQLELEICKMKAKLLEKCNKLDQAIIMYKRIIELKPNDISNHQELIQLHEKYSIIMQPNTNQYNQ